MHSPMKTVALPVLARQFRQTLKLREGVDVTDGRLEAQWQWADRRMLADLELAGLQGTFGGRVLRLSEALRAHTRFRWQQAALDLEELRIEAPFATGDLSSDREQLAYRFEVDLASLYRECGAFLDLGTLQLRLQDEPRTGGQQHDHGVAVVLPVFTAAAGCAVGEEDP